MTRGDKAFLAGLALAAAGAAWWAVSTHRHRRAVSAAFAPALDSYLAQPKETIDLQDKHYRRGRLVVVDAGRRRLDPLHFKLPDEIRADHPSQAGTAALLRRETHQSRDYAFFAKGYYVDWELTLLDLATGVQSARMGWGMSPPDRSRIPLLSRYGGKPTRDMLKQLRELKEK
jgi:hypothetical protein